MSKDYISPEHAIRNIMDDKKDHIEEQQLDEYVALANLARVAAPLVTTGTGAKVLSKTAPKVLKNVDDYLDDLLRTPASVKTTVRPATAKPAAPAPVPVKPTAPAPVPVKPTAPAPAAPLPVIAPLPSVSTTPDTDKKPAEAPAPVTAPLPSVSTTPDTDKKPAEAPAAPAPTRSDNKKKTRFRFPRPSLTPGQSIGVHKNAVVPVDTYTHMAGEYITHFEEKDIDRTEIENVARPKSDRNKVMARNQSIKKQIIDETSRRKKTIKDTINLKPETNDYEVNEIQEQSIIWADNTPDDLRRGAFSRMSPAKIAQKLNDPYWRSKIEPYIKNIKDFRTKPITPSSRDIDTSKVKKGKVPINRTNVTTIDPKTGKTVSSFNKFLKFIPKNLLGVAGVVLDPLLSATPAGEGSARSDANSGIGEIDQEYVDQYKRELADTETKPSEPETNSNIPSDKAGTGGKNVATTTTLPSGKPAGSSVGGWSPTQKRKWAAGLRPGAGALGAGAVAAGLVGPGLMGSDDNQKASADDIDSTSRPDPETPTIDLNKIPVPTPRPEPKVKKSTPSPKSEVKTPSGISDLAWKRAKADTARNRGDAGFVAGEAKRAAGIQRAMDKAAQSRQEFAAKRQATVQNLRNLFQQNRQR